MVLAVVAGLLLVYLVLLTSLWRYARARPETVRLRDSLRLLPDLLRLLRRLAGDRSLPRGVRIRLVLLLAYLASPIDLVPDFVPIAGQLDDAIVVVLAIRLLLRGGGPRLLSEHWPGPARSLEFIRRLAY
jgi:uncharacterized membrane protein YkvA (DUF1232 family)